MFASASIGEPMTSAKGEALDLASIDLVLSTTRSVRRNLDFEREIDPALIMECIDLATRAPTGIPGQNWRFVLVADAAQKARLAALYESTLYEYVERRGISLKATQKALVARLHEMPLLICVCAIGEPPGDAAGEQVAFYGSILPAAWSLMLALRARGLGATWTTLLSARQQEVREILAMPSDAMLTVMLPVAHMRGARLSPAERLSASEVCFRNAWGGESRD